MNLSVFHAFLLMNGMSSFRLQQINKITEMAPDFTKCFCILFYFVKVYILNTLIVCVFQWYLVFTYMQQIFSDSCSNLLACNIKYDFTHWMLYTEYNARYTLFLQRTLFKFKEQ